MKTFPLLFALINCSFINAQNILISEDFEGGNFPAGWSITTNASDGGWNMGTSQMIESAWWSIASHGNIIGSNDDDCDCDKSMDYLIMPPLDLSGSVTIALQFENYYDGGNFGGASEMASIEYSLNNGNTWVVLSEIIGTDDASWDSQLVDLSVLAGNSNVLIAFHYNDNGGWVFGWAIDDVLVFGSFGKFGTRIGLWLYDKLAGVASEDKRKILSKEKTITIEPTLRTDILKGSGYYAEYRTDDARLTLEIIKTAVQLKATTINYTAATELLYENKTITGVKCIDDITKTSFSIKAKKIVNATGPWVDELREKDKSLSEKKLHLTK